MITSDERRCFEKIYNSYHKWVLFQAFTYTELLADAEDISHDVFAVLLERWDKMCGIHQWEPILHALIRQLYYKRLKYGRRIPLEKRETFEALVDDCVFEYEHKEHYSWLWKAICHLPTKQRLIVKLRYKSHFSDEKIAVVAGISDDSVKLHLRTARARDRKIPGGAWNDRIC